MLPKFVDRCGRNRRPSILQPKVLAPFSVGFGNFSFLHDKFSSNKEPKSKQKDFIYLHFRERLLKQRTTSQYATILVPKSYDYQIETEQIKILHAVSTTRKAPLTLVEVNICVFGASGNLSKVKNSLSQGIVQKHLLFCQLSVHVGKKKFLFRGFLKRNRLKRYLPLPEGRNQRETAGKKIQPNSLRIDKSA